MNPQTLRKIVALCQPIDYAESLDETSGSAALKENQNHIIAHARRVLRERGIDVRWDTGDWYWNNTEEVGKVCSTEAECVCAALEASQPKVEKKERWTTIKFGRGAEFYFGGTYKSPGEVLALLNAPHYTQADMDALRAELAPRMGNSQLAQRTLERNTAEAACREALYAMEDMTDMFAYDQIEAVVAAVDARNGGAK